jgi:hypothetical protein
MPTLCSYFLNFPSLLAVVNSVPTSAIFRMAWDHTRPPVGKVCKLRHCSLTSAPWVALYFHPSPHMSSQCDTWLCTLALCTLLSCVLFVTACDIAAVSRPCLLTVRSRVTLLLSAERACQLYGAEWHCCCQQTVPANCEEQSNIADVSRPCLLIVWSRVTFLLSADCAC